MLNTHIHKHTQTTTHTRTHEPTACEHLHLWLPFLSAPTVTSYRPLLYQLIPFSFFFLCVCVCVCVCVYLPVLANIPQAVRLRQHKQNKESKQRGANKKRKKLIKTKLNIQNMKCIYTLFICFAKCILKETWSLPGWPYLATVDQIHEMRHR